jgi:hypothetical protein
VSNAKKHPNKEPFVGILVPLDVPSDKAPAGAQGHRVIATSEAAAAALWSLEGMGLNFSDGYDAHNPRQKCGVITAAMIRPFGNGNAIFVEGYIFGRDYPDVVATLVPFADRTLAAAHALKTPKFGMSFEMNKAKVEDMSAAVWKLERFIFTGATVLLREKAAYKSTGFALHAGEDNFTGRLGFAAFKLKTSRAART